MISRLRFAAAVAGASASFGIVSAAARAAQFEFKCGSDNPIDHPTTVPMRQMWAAIERESGGRIHTEFFPNSQLGSGAATFTQLRAGAIHFLIYGIGFLATLVPATDVGFLGFTYRDQDEGVRVMDGALGDYLRAEAAAKGLYALRDTWTSGMYVISNSVRPIRTPDDLRGLKVRVGTSKISVDLFKDLGGVPSPLANAEVYPALQTKIVDGVAVPLASIEGAGWWEVQKYVSVTNHAFNGLWVVTTTDLWKSLPPDLQDLVARNNLRYARFNRQLAKTMNRAADVKMRGQGLALNPVDQAPFRARLGGYFKEWANAFGPTEWNLLQSSLGRKLV